MGLFDRWKKVPKISELEIPLQGGDQNALHDLKLRITADGFRGTLGLEADEPGPVFITLAGKHIGEIPEPLRPWIYAHWDLLGLRPSLVVRGGGYTEEGELRPFVAVICVTLCQSVPAPDWQPEELPPAAWIWNGQADQVVYADAAGLVHTALCSTPIRGCTPMLLWEAEAAGLQPCPLCMENDNAET